MAHVEVAPHALPFVAGDGATGVLLCHGFTGSPRSFGELPQRLVAAGYRVRLPRLPGHGTSWQELNGTEWSDWYATVDREFTRLHAEVERVVVAGLSMGGALALRLAARHGADVGGIILVNPAVANADPRLRALPLLKRVLPSIAGIEGDIAKPGVDERGYSRTPLRALSSMIELWREVRTELSAVDQPLLLFRSTVDHVVDPSSAAIILDRVSSPVRQEVLLERSYHVATMDYDADLIARLSVAFLRELDSGPGSPE